MGAMIAMGFFVDGRYGVAVRLENKLAPFCRACITVQSLTLCRYGSRGIKII